MEHFQITFKEENSTFKTNPAAVRFWENMVYLL